MPPHPSTREVNDPPAEMAMSSLVWICSNVQNRFSQVGLVGTERNGTASGANDASEPIYQVSVVEAA